MPIVTKHQPNTFCWAALASSDVADAKAFYSELFNWKGMDQEFEGTMSTMMIQDARPVCALFSLSAELRDAGFPPNWLPYLSVDSADETAAGVEGAGGKMVEPPFDISGVGRMAPFVDSTGARLAMWQPMLFRGAGLWGEPHALGWMELASTDCDAGARFYTEALGWRAEAGDDRTYFYAGETLVAGMTQVDSAEERGSRWLIGVSVSDCDAAIERARALGGSVEAAPILVPRVGRLAVLRDRQRASFALVERGGRQEDK